MSDTRSHGVFRRAPRLDVLRTGTLLALAWATTAAVIGFMGGEPAYSAALILTLISFVLLVVGEYDAASWICLSSILPWVLRA